MANHGGRTGISHPVAVGFGHLDYTVRSSMVMRMERR